MKIAQQKIESQNLMGMPHQDLVEYFSEVGEKPFQ